MAVKDAKTITYKIEIQDTGFAKVQSSAGKLNFAFKDLGKAIDAISKNVDKHTKAHGRTANVIRSEIRAVENLRDSFAKNNKEYLQAELRIQSLENEYRDLTKTQSRVVIGNQSMSKGLGNVKSATGSASGAVIELGRTISDSNYGFPAMANNVQQLATQMTFVVAEQGGVVKGFKSIIKAMTGAGGVLLLFTIGVTLIERFALKSREAKEEINDLNKSIASETSSLKILLSVAKDETLNKETRQKAIKEINEEYPEYLSNLSLENIGTDKLNKLIQKQIELEIARAKAKAIADEIAKENIKILDAEASSVTDNLTTTQSAIAAFATNIAQKTGVGMASVTKKIIDKGTENQEKTIEESKNRIERLTKDLTDILKDTPSAIDAITGIDGDKKRDEEAFFFGFGNVIKSIFKKAREEEEEASKDLARTSKRRADNLAKELTSIISERFKEINQIVNSVGSAFDAISKISESYHEGEIQRLQRERDFVQNNNSLSESEKLQSLERIKKEEEKAQVRKIKAEQTFLMVQQGVLLAETIMNSKKMIMEQNILALKLATMSAEANAKINISAVTNMAEGKMSIGTFFSQLGVGGGIAFAAAIGGIIATIVSAKKQAKNQIASITGKSPIESGGGGSQAQPPEFNIVGASQQSQLAQTIAQAEQQPTRAYVVAEDVTTAQQLDRNIIQGASLG